jgi:UDP:flavonoid glycosyltransferase YjiC (YdhE family)
MRRVIDALAQTPHRYIVSKGPLHDELVLAPNMWGAEFLPQTELLPLVDLVITHGGNNTTTEAVHFGVPMIVLPLFWDQYDNAQRVHETGFGIRLDPYRFTDDELIGAIRQLLADDAVRDRLTAAGERIRATDGVARAADLIEQAARAGA